MSLDKTKYEDMFLETESSEEMDSVINYLSQNGYVLEEDESRMYREPDLSGRPGVDLPVGHNRSVDIRIPERVNDGLTKAAQTLVPDGLVKFMAPGMTIEDDRIYALTETDYYALEDAGKEILEQ